MDAAVIGGSLAIVSAITVLSWLRSSRVRAAHRATAVADLRSDVQYIVDSVLHYAESQSLNDVIMRGTELADGDPLAEEFDDAVSMVPRLAFLLVAAAKNTRNDVRLAATAMQEAADELALNTVVRFSRGRGCAFDCVARRGKQSAGQ
jgi:hypothetical protein